MGLIYRVDYMHDHPAIWAEFVRESWHELKETNKLPDTPIWHYLERKHDLAPHRFDHNHPCLAKLFRYEHDHEVLSSSPPPPPVVHLGTVPEPSGIVLVATAIIVVFLASFCRASPSWARD